MGDTAPKLSNAIGTDWDKFSAKFAKTFSSMTETPAKRAIQALLYATNEQLPFSKATGIIDNGCGPGPIMSALIVQHGNEIPGQCKMLCSDFSQGMVDQVHVVKQEQAAKGNSVWPRVDTLVSNAMDMHAVPTASQSHVLAGWVYFMAADPQRCLAESKRILTHGGVLAATSWEDSQWLHVLRQIPAVAPKRVMPTLPAEWITAEAVRKEFEKAGFSNVKSENVEVYMGFETHTALLDMLLAMPHCVAMVKDASEEELAEIKQAMLKKLKELEPNEPGRLSGDAIVTVGTNS